MGRHIANLTLSSQDHQFLRQILDDRTKSHRQQIVANVLMRIAERQSAGQAFRMHDVATEFGITARDVSQIVREYQTGSTQQALERCLVERTRPVVSPQMVEALEQLLKEPVPERSKFGRWTRQVLAEELGSRGFPCSPTSVREALTVLHRRNAERK